MKTLSDYTKDATTKAFNECGAFFAFSNEQLEENLVEGVKYANMGAGLVCPLNKCAELKRRLTDITTNAIAQDIAENGLHNIIARELHNHECFYTGDVDDTVRALAGYGVTYDDVLAVYKTEMGNLDVKSL